MNIIPSKAAMIITSAGWRWVHESAWEDQHLAFAEKCPCFSNFGLLKMTWTKQTGTAKKPAATTGFFRAGRWILERTTDHALLAAAQLQWEISVFERGWLFISEIEPQMLQSLPEPPLYWLLEALINRLCPDLLTLAGDIPSALRLITSPKLVTSFTATREVKTSVPLMELTVEAWHNFESAQGARTELSWVRKRTEREKREEKAAAAPRKRPFLLRILISLSPMRRPSREKMIHPITRYRQKSL